MLIEETVIDAPASSEKIHKPLVDNHLVKQAVKVHKFGGSSLATKECIERVVTIIQQNCQLNDIIVVSANGNTTDKLLHIYDLAIASSDQLHPAISSLHETQVTLITELLSPEHTEDIIELVSNDISQLLDWVQLDIAAYRSDLLALGEIWSARLLAAILSERICASYAIDARECLILENEQHCLVDYALSSIKLSSLKTSGGLAVITGYIAKNKQGQSCTLGRNGSDYSATIIAKITEAQSVTLWTDVDGIYSADPRIVPNARKLNRVPRAVAEELGRLGNPILHAKTLQPLNTAGGHLTVASSFDSAAIGTEVGDFGQIAQQELSVTHLNDLVLAQSESFVGELGEQASSLFGAIVNDSALGLLIVKQDKQRAVSEWLASHDTEVRFTPVSIIAAVGYKVAERGAVKLRLKRALQEQKINHLLSGKNGHSYIAVISQPSTSELLNKVHHQLTKDARHIGLVVMGTGNIGSTFISLLANQIARVPALENVHLVAVASSNKILIDNDGLEVNDVLQQFECDSQPYVQEELLNWLTHHPYDELVIVDITPSEQFSKLYSQFFQQGIHVIGANKWAASSSIENYRALHSTANKHKSIWLGNTVVGAGLPINYAIDDLIKSGDEIIEISGIFSGTLSWLFEKYDGEVPFDVLLKQALADGITEPDPRDDLSGLDVQRKLLILARLAGFEMSLEDIECQNLVPETLRSLSIDNFLRHATQLNEYFEAALHNAQQQNACIRYVARLIKTNQGIKAKVSLETLPSNDPFASLTPCDNIFKIVSSWYQDNPLIIRGPGAGRDVTAGGLHSDLVNVCQQLINKPQQVKLKGITE